MLNVSRICLFIAYALCAFLFTQIYFSATAENHEATLESLTDLTAARPFQCRILVPIAARAIRSVLRVDLEAIYFLLTMFITLGLLIAFRQYLELFLSEEAAYFGALAIFYPMIWNYCVFGSIRLYYPSDIAAILFFVLGLRALHTRKWLQFYAVFAIATLNRETSCFLAFAYLFVMFRKHNLRKLLLNVFLQFVIWALIKLMLVAVFVDNEGGPFEIHLRDNLGMLSSILRFKPDSGILMMLSVCGCIWLLIPLSWGKQPEFFKRVLLLVLPFLAGMAIVGNLHEIRIYNELIPVFTAPAIHGMRELVKRGRDAK